ncbi:MAG: AraC family transcriptional regulator [Rhizobiaceae bacterium]|nr:MAG: AraC family transcriptional regulator [Rhizobiaceae bacterium]
MVLLPLARVAGEGVALRVVEFAPEPDARIGEACARLSGTAQPIRHIAASVGYASMANFNRQFLRLRGMTPREYRASFHQ